jgi:GGDEF domain-containing protein
LWQGLIEAGRWLRSLYPLATVFSSRFLVQIQSQISRSVTADRSSRVLGPCSYRLSADQVHAQLLMFYPVLFVFGLLQLATGQLLGLGLFALTSYAAVVALLWHQQPDKVNVSMELVHGLTLGLWLTWFALLGGYVSKLRSRLRHSLKTIEQMAIRDDLTGLHNRRYFMEVLALEKQRSDRSGAAFCLCMLDLDWFKTINDNFGHAAGDEVLKGFARVLEQNLRTTDHLSRYGGEEFVLVLSDSTLAQAWVCAEQFERRPRSWLFPKLIFNLGSPISGIAHRSGENLTRFGGADAYEAKQAVQPHRRCCRRRRPVSAAE